MGHQERACMRVALPLLTPTNPCTYEHTGMAVWAAWA